MRKLNASLTRDIERGRTQYLAVRASAVPEDQLQPEERRRLCVMKVVEQIKQDRAYRKASNNPVPPPPPEGPGGDWFPELMDNPEYARLSLITWKYGWIANQSRRFRWAKIPAEKQEKLYELILDAGFTSNEALDASQKIGLSPEQAWNAREKAMVGVQAEIMELLGRETYEKLQAAGHSTEANEMLRSLEARLSYSNEPLREDQAQAIFGAALEAKIQFMLRPEQIAPLIEKAKPFLSEAQHATFRDVVNEYNYGKHVEVTPSK